MNDSIIELQSKLLFQEDALQKLDEIVIRQQHHIDQLLQRVTQLEEKLDSLQYQQELADTNSHQKPPHY